MEGNSRRRDTLFGILPDLIEHVSFAARTKKNTLIIEHLNGTSKDKALSLSLNKSYPTKPKLEIQRVKTPIDRHSIRKSLQSALLAFSHQKLPFKSRFHKQRHARFSFRC